MSWKRLLKTPPPTTCWSLDGEVVAGVRRDAKGQLYSATSSLPERAVEVGPIGLQSVDREMLGKVLTAVQNPLQGARRPALVVPTAWVRCHLLDFDELPRRRADVDDVLRWRLKRLLPVPPGEMRISWVPVGVRGDKKLLLSMTAIGRAVAALEQAFAAVGMAPGLITPRILALVQGVVDTPETRLVIQQEKAFLSLAMLRGNSLVMLRTKPMPPMVAEDQAVSSELHLSWTYLREGLRIDEPIRVRIVAESAVVRDSLQRWFATCQGVTIDDEPVAPPTAIGGEGMSPAAFAPIDSVLHRGLA